MVDLSALLVTPDYPVRDAMVAIDQGAEGIAIIVDSTRHLLGVITDGDIRRAILNDTDLSIPIADFLKVKTSQQYPSTITSVAGVADSELLRLMSNHKVRQIPIVDSSNRVIDLALLSDLLNEYKMPMTAVIMAGGQGKRLRPLTDSLPKPMLPVGDRPLMERVIRQLRDAGIRKVNVTTHYKPDKITEHFGDGSEFGISITYVQEGKPLGTAGGIGLLGVSDEPLLVINGDVFTQVNYEALLEFHRQNQADMTVAVRVHEFQIPFGVVETDGIMVRGISEKPVVRNFINAGIYVLNPSVRNHISSGEPLDMPELISRLLAAEERVLSFPVHEYWLDIGNHKAYEQAQSDAFDQAWPTQC